MESIKTLFSRLKKYAEINNLDFKKIEQAYKLAESLHKGQKRKSGESYIIHPLKVACYLADYQADEESIISAILHDTVEDTPYTFEETARDFGVEVKNLIDGLTKFTKHKFRNADTLDRKIESLRKWFEVMQGDIRVAVIKLFDRLHNMETLSAHNNSEKERRIAKETLDVFVKIARKLGMNSLKEQLEDYCLEYIDPKDFEALSEIRKKEIEESQKVLPVIQKKLKKLDTGGSIQKIKHEPPALMKMYEQEIQAKEQLKGVLPLIFSVTVENIEDCYHVLYLIHSLWKTESKGVTDYINTPTPSGYKGLHTTIIYEEGKYILFKIRTKEMEEYVKFGATLSCFRKETRKEPLFHWISHLPILTQSTKEDSQVFWNQLQHDILEESIIVHTSKEDALLLPANSTALDATFHSYGKEALKLKQLWINGESASIYTQLNQNDTLHFEFGKKEMVEYEWLEYVDTALSLSFIREGLQMTDEDKKVKLGEKIFERELLKEGKGFLDEMNTKTLGIFLEKYKTKALNDFYKNIAEGKINPYEASQCVQQSKTNRTDIKPYEAKITLDLNKEKEETSIKKLLKEFIVKRYLFDKKNGYNRLNIWLCFENQNQERMLINYMKKCADIASLKIIHQKEFIRLILMIVGIVAFWGVEPALVYFAYHNINILPAELIFIRFWLITPPFLLWMMTNVIVKKNKMISVFDKKLILPVVSMLGVVFFKYNTLLETIPSYYMVLDRNHVFLTAFCTAPFLSYFYKKKSTFFKWLLAVIVANVALLFFTPTWSWEFKFSSILAMTSFWLFSISTQYFLKASKVKMRYYQFITIVYLYCTIIVTLLGNVSLERVFILMKKNTLLLVVLSATVFIPYVFTYYINLKHENRYYTNIPFSFTWIITLVSEVLLLGMNINPVIVFSGIFLTTGIFFITKIQNQKAII